MIETHGVKGLTLRAVGDSLAVSRTALYRHFADKAALLADVAAEGFRLLRLETVAAREKGGGGRRGFEDMGVAYVRFAIRHPSHYRVMFGADISDVGNSELAKEGAGAFQVLVDSIVEQQRDGLVRTDEPLQMAHYIWAVVHGIAMLAIDKRLNLPHADVGGLSRYAVERIRTGIGTRPA
jgi:AcrR family transcriptional regulator